MSTGDGDGEGARHDQRLAREVEAHDGVGGEGGEGDGQQGGDQGDAQRVLEGRRELRVVEHGAEVVEVETLVGG